MFFPSVRALRYSRFTRIKEHIWSCIYKRTSSFSRTRLPKDLAGSRTIGIPQIARRDQRQKKTHSSPLSITHDPHPLSRHTNSTQDRSIQGISQRITHGGRTQRRRQDRREANDKWSAGTCQNHHDSRIRTFDQQRFGHSSDRRIRHHSEQPQAQANVPAKISQDRSGVRSSRSDHQKSARTPSRSDRFGRCFESMSRQKVYNYLPEFFHAVPPHHFYRQSTQELLTHFTSPPIMPGLLSSLKDVIGSEAQPTPIQTLSMKHLFGPEDEEKPRRNKWQQFLLASETGSGKSIAYLLPVLQALKRSELQSHSFSTTPPRSSQSSFNPRALILAPTHELSRQLAGFAKALSHTIKLRVVCTSKANVRSQGQMEGTASKMAGEHKAIIDGVGEFDLEQKSKPRPVDVMVGTPMKMLEMIKGRGWDENGGNIKPFKDRKGESEMGLVNVEWVVVDEADVLFDPDFQQSTRLLLADISAARGHPVLYSLHSSPSARTPVPVASTPIPLEYPFNFLLTSATIPSSLAAYLDTYHPTLTRLISPNLHHLPNTLQTEHVCWTGGNRNTDIERRIKKVWAEDALSGGVVCNTRSKMLVFCNKSTKVEELGKYLEEKGIRNLALTSSSESRKRGSNHHLDGFLRLPLKRPLDPVPTGKTINTSISTIPVEEPHVIITTSLLSRGLDFSPAIRHVFIVDEPRNMIDFLHRAGRTGRAGESGKVVVFGKLKGRGSKKAREVRHKVGTLVTHGH